MEKIKCLIVDDNGEIVDMYREIIEEHPQAEVVLATNKSKVAMEAIRDPNFAVDLVFTDLRMPDYSGLDILSALQVRKNTKAYLATGSNIEKEQINSSALLGILSKPVFPGKLVKAIDDYLAVR